MDKANQTQQISQGRKPTSPLGILRAALTNLAGADRVGQSKDGTFKAKATYFYRHGRSAEGFRASCQKVLPAGFEIVEAGDHWAAWPSESYFWVSIRFVAAPSMEAF